MRLVVHAVVACLAGPLAAGTARASAPSEQATGPEAIVVRAAGLDVDALREALALRVPEVRLHDDAWDEMSCETGRTLARVEREPGESLRISVQLADGRVFVRRLSATPAEPERAAATSLAHLLAAIADGSAEPEPPQEPSVAAEPGPAVAESEPHEPVAPPQPVVARPTGPPAVPSSARFEVGPSAGFVTVFGVGPPAALAGSVGSGGLVGVELRHRGGLLAGIEARGLGSQAEGVRLGRLRVAASLGHSLRRGLFELRTRVGLHVEPWWVVTRGDGGRRQSGAPLLGAALSLTPGLSLALAPDVRITVGLRMEAALSAHATAGAAVQLVDSMGAPVFRLGGVELAAAAEIGVRWGRPRRR